MADVGMAGGYLLFNTVQNKSVEWGVLPWHWYFTREIPKAVHVCLPMAIFGLIGSQLTY